MQLEDLMMPTGRGRSWGERVWMRLRMEGLATGTDGCIGPDEGDHSTGIVSRRPGGGAG